MQFLISILSSWSEYIVYRVLLPPGQIQYIVKWIFNVKWHWFTGFVPLLEQKIQGLSRAPFLFFKDSIQCKKEPWVYVFFTSSTTWVILSKCLSVLAAFSLEFYLNYKVSIEIQALSSTNCNFQGLKRPYTSILKFKDFQGACKTWGLYVLLKLDWNIKTLSYVEAHSFNSPCMLYSTYQRRDHTLHLSTLPGYGIVLSGSPLWNGDAEAGTIETIRF